jgi:hypothetical protein
MSATTNYVVQINADGSQTIPPNTIATPAQVEALSNETETVHAAATNIETRAAECVDKVRLYGSNYVVTSTVYVQSIGGVPYDPSNQTIRVHSLTADSESVTILATVRQTPLVTPALDWRAALNAGAWSNATATVQEVAVPAGATNAVKAYEFTLDRPDTGGSAFFRVVDNSTGASGSGLWWVVFGGIAVDGQLGRTGIVTNGVDELRFVGGILVEPDPLGGL